MNHSTQPPIHTTLQLLFIGLLIGGSFWVLEPFLLALIWAIIIVVATWPTRIQGWQPAYGRLPPRIQSRKSETMHSCALQNSDASSPAGRYVFGMAITE